MVRVTTVQRLFLQGEPVDLQGYFLDRPMPLDRLILRGFAPNLLVEHFARHAYGASDGICYLHDDEECVPVITKRRRRHARSPAVA